MLIFFLMNLRAGGIVLWVLVVRGRFRFKFQTEGVDGSRREVKRWGLTAEVGHVVYLVSSGNLNQTLTHHILPGLLKTKPVSANKQRKMTCVCVDIITGEAEGSTDLVHLYQLSVRPGPLDRHLHNIRWRRHVAAIKAVCKKKKKKAISKKRTGVMTIDWGHFDSGCKISPFSFTMATERA